MNIRIIEYGKIFFISLIGILIGFSIGYSVGFHSGFWADLDKTQLNNYELACYQNMTVLQCGMNWCDCGFWNMSGDVVAVDCPCGSGAMRIFYNDSYFEKEIQPEV